MPDLLSLPLAANAGIFIAAGVMVWITGVRLSRWAASLSAKTGIGDAILGIVLLGGITSLPEIAVSVTGAASGAVALSVNNLLGGLAFQVALLAVADAFNRDALTSVNAQPAVILQGALVCVLLTVVAIAIAVGDVALPIGVGAWSLALLPLYALSVTLLGKARGVSAWRPARRGAGRAQGREQKGEHVPDDDLSIRALSVRIAIAAAIILLSGAVATRAAEAIAEQTGLGNSFVGAVLLAAATSFPELSTAIEAVRLRRVGLAFGDVFGTNLIDASLILLVDAIAGGPPVINQLDEFSLVAALMGVLLTMIYIVGLVERRDRAVLRMGVDSIAVLASYLGGLFLLYQLR